MGAKRPFIRHWQLGPIGFCALTWRERLWNINSNLCVFIPLFFKYHHRHWNFQWKLLLIAWIYFLPIPPSLSRLCTYIYVGVYFYSEDNIAEQSCWFNFSICDWHYCVLYYFVFLLFLFYFMKQTIKSCENYEINNMKMENYFLFWMTFDIIDRSIKRLFSTCLTRR
jgi:hypothetical protein